MRSRAVWFLAASALLAAGCLASDAAERADDLDGGSSAPRIAYLAPAPPDDPSSAPAFAAARISAIVAAGPNEEPATVDWIELPVGEAVAVDAALGSLTDYDAAIVGPGVGRGALAKIAEVVEAMSIPAVSLSGGSPGHLYVVAPDRRRLVSTMVEAAGRGACAAWEEGGADTGRLLARLVEPARGGAGGLGFSVASEEEDRAAAAIVGADCEAIVWSGSPASAGELMAELSDEGAMVPMIGADALRDADFADAAGDAADGTIIVSGARDVSTRLRLEVRRFIQDYQAEVGSPPQPYAVEGWDAARIILRVLREGPLQNVVWEGLGGPYVLGGEVEPPTFLYSLRGHRWLPVGA